MSVEGNCFAPGMKSSCRLSPWRHAGEKRGSLAGSVPQSRDQSPARATTRSRIPVREGSTVRNRGERPETKSVRTEVQKRSRTVSPWRRSAYSQAEQAAAAGGKPAPAGRQKDTAETSGQRAKPAMLQGKRRPATTDIEEVKDRSRKCFALVDEACAKILETKEKLNAEDVRMLADRLKERLTKGGVTLDGGGVYREDSSYRLIKSEHQHNHVMVNCGLKKGPKSAQAAKKADRFKAEANERAKPAEIPHEWKPKAEHASDKSKKSNERPAEQTGKKQTPSTPVKEKSRKSRNREKPRIPETSAVEQLIAVDDLTGWKRLPDTVQNLVDYITTKQSAFDLCNDGDEDAGHRQLMKKWSGVNDRREKIKTWDLQRRLTLGVKVETRALERNDGLSGTSLDVTPHRLDDAGKSSFYLNLQNSKTNVFNPDNEGPLYEGVFSGGDVETRVKDDVQRLPASAVSAPKDKHKPKPGNPAQRSGVSKY